MFNPVILKGGIVKNILKKAFNHFYYHSSAICNAIQENNT